MGLEPQTARHVQLSQMTAASSHPDQSATSLTTSPGNITPPTSEACSVLVPQRPPYCGAGDKGQTLILLTEMSPVPPPVPMTHLSAIQIAPPRITSHPSYRTATFYPPSWTLDQWLRIRPTFLIVVLTHCIMFQDMGQQTERLIHKRKI